MLLDMTGSFFVPKTTSQSEFMEVNVWNFSIAQNPASKSQGVKQLVAGGGVALIGLTLVPLLSGLLG